METDRRRGGIIARLLQRYQQAFNFRYSQLETVARKFNIKGANGDTLLGDQYRESVNAVQKQEIVMNLAHYRLL